MRLHRFFFDDSVQGGAGFAEDALIGGHDFPGFIGWMRKPALKSARRNSEIFAQECVINNADCFVFKIEWILGIKEEAGRLGSRHKSRNLPVSRNVRGQVGAPGRDGFQK